MKRLLPIFAVVALLLAAGYFLLNDSQKTTKLGTETFEIGEFRKVKSCSTLPMFLYASGIKRPMIDLSQEKFTGIAFFYGRDFSQVLHKKEWEKYEHLGTYTIDSRGNIYLTPNPFISIKPTTFNLQKAIYKMDSKSGNLERWMVIDEVKATPNNPYGLISIAHDCDDGTLWASAIDKSDFKGSKGRIYHINPKNREILEKVEGFDALTINILKTNSAKYLVAGSAMDNGLYAFTFNGNSINKNAHKILTLPKPNLHIRKIKVIGKNRLKLEAIKFNYSLVAETNKKQRFIFIATYNPKNSNWEIKEEI